MHAVRTKVKKNQYGIIIPQPRQQKTPYDDGAFCSFTFQMELSIPLNRLQ